MSIYHVHTGKPQDMARHLIDSHDQAEDTVQDSDDLALVHSLCHEMMGREMPFGGVEGCRKR